MARNSKKSCETSTKSVVLTSQFTTTFTMRSIYIANMSGDAMDSAALNRLFMATSSELWIANLSQLTTGLHNINAFVVENSSRKAVLRKNPKKALRRRNRRRRERPSMSTSRKCLNKTLTNPKRLQNQKNLWRSNKKHQLQPHRSLLLYRRQRL